MMCYIPVGGVMISGKVMLSGKSVGAGPSSLIKQSSFEGLFESWSSMV